MKPFLYILLASILITGTSDCASLQKSRDEAMRAHTCTNIKNLEIAAETFYFDTARYPVSLQDLVTDPGYQGWTGPYISGGAIAKDAWGTPFRYELLDGVPRITSAGPDKIFGTEDDIDCRKQ